MNTRRAGLDIGAIGASLVALALALVAAVTSAADSGESLGPQFLIAERVWPAAAGVSMAAVDLGVGSIISSRGRRLGVVALAVVILAGPVAIIMMDSLLPA